MVGEAPVDVPPKNGDGDERGEPEEHGQELDAGNSKFVRGAREARGCQGKVRDCKQGPYRCEQHEVQAVGRPAGPRIGVQADNYSTLVDDLK